MLALVISVTYETDITGQPRKMGITGKILAQTIKDTLNTRILNFFTQYLDQD